MEIRINGQAEEVAEEMSLEEYLLAKGLDLNKVVVEYNEQIVKRPEWATTQLQDQDCLEVLRFVGGG